MTDRSSGLPLGMPALREVGSKDHVIKVPEAGPEPAVTERGPSEPRPTLLVFKPAPVQQPRGRGMRLTWPSWWPEALLGVFLITMAMSDLILLRGIRQLCVLVILAAVSLLLIKPYLPSRHSARPHGRAEESAN